MASNPNSQNVINCIKKRKSDLKSIFDSKCCICGFDDFTEALEFHHVDPTQKEFGLSSANSTTKSLEKQLIEAKKCVLVCANCHRGIHAGYIEVPKDWERFFSEERARELIEQKERLIRHQDKHCQRCGKVIDRQATYCVDCWNLLKRKVDRPTREDLKKLIRTLPFTRVAEQFGVSDNAIRKWCDSYGLPHKKTEINKISDENWAKI